MSQFVYYYRSFTVAENVDLTAATILLEISGVDSLITINFERQFAYDDL